MRKFQLFLLAEALLLTMALVTILGQDVPRFFLILVLILLAFKFYNLGNKIELWLTSSLLVLFLIVMLNPYVIAGLLLAVAYTVINHFAQVKKKNREAILHFAENGMALKHNPHQWIGYQVHMDNDFYVFDDINVIRVSGTDIINLNDVILTGCDNVILIRKIYGSTKIIVPIDVGVKLDVSCLYGNVRFFEQADYDLRNETLKLQSKGYTDAIKKVKIVVNVIAGPVEVVSA